MSAASADAWFERIVPEVAEYESGYFQLGPELRRLYAVREVGAIEAVVFYGARVLEALAADALSAVRIPASVNLFSNLVTLEQYSLLTKGALNAAHTLRRLGNEARHIQAALTHDRAEHGLALTERVLRWFFLHLPVRPRLSQLCRDGCPLDLATDAFLATTLVQAEELGHTWASAWTELSEPQRASLIGSPQAAAIVAETWLDRDKIDAARELLRDALPPNPTDLRLQQLELLAASRQGDLLAAHDQAERLVARNSDDDETLGIVAGVYKRIWQENSIASHWLSKSHKLYRSGWTNSKRQNAYLGINAATTALWLGNRDQSRRLAGDVESLLNARSERLRQCTEELRERRCAVPAPDYWTQVTLAESLLLQSKFAAATDAYRIAFERYPDQVGSIQVTRNQLRTIAEAMGAAMAEINSPGPGSFCPGAPG